MKKGLDHWADILIVVLYFIAVIAVGLWSLRAPNRGNVKSYFLAGRSMPWIAVGASLYSSNIGSEHFVGLAGAGASTGIALILFEWIAIFLILATGWLYLPVYIWSGVYTLPEYIEKRHGGKKLRIYLSILALILHTITRLAVSIFAGALYIQLSLGWNMYLSVAVLLCIAGFYTMLGGLTAVMYTDTFQTAVMTIGSLIVVGIGFHKVGGVSELKLKYANAVPSIKNNNTTCGLPKDDAFSLFLDPTQGDYPWPGLIIQSSIGCMWYWCCDQVVVQRSLSARSLSHAKGGAIVVGFMKLLPLYFFIYPGMISRVLFPASPAYGVYISQLIRYGRACSNYEDFIARGQLLTTRLQQQCYTTPRLKSTFRKFFGRQHDIVGVCEKSASDEVACVDPEECKRICDNPVGCSNIAYPKLVLELLPVALRGLLIAVMISAIMSSLTSIFNSSSTVFTMDIWRQIRPKATQRELLITGRTFVVFMCGISILWIPLVKSSESGRLFQYMTAVEGCIASPLGIIFVLSVFWKRTTENGVFWGLLLTHICGLIRLILVFVYPSPTCGEPETRPAILYKVHYLYFSPLLLLFCAIVVTAISLITEPRTESELEGVTWWTRYHSISSETMSGEKINENDESERDDDKSGIVALNEVKDENDIKKDEVTIQEKSEISSQQHLNWHQRIAKFLCGLPDAEYEESTNLMSIRVFLTQNPIAKKILNVAAAILLCLLFFLTGFYR